jgi:hypothetical protein
MSKRFVSDIDIDLADRDQLLPYIKHTSATMRHLNPIRKHNSGIYVTDVVYDPVLDSCALDYTIAEQRGYVKLDLLNVWIYKHVNSEEHLAQLMQEPDWSMLKRRKIVEKLIHLGSHADIILKLLEPIDSISRLAMFLAIIRPGKRHLIGESWKKINETVWDKSEEGYTFKRSHAIAYAHLVVVHMNLITENPDINNLFTTSS